MISMLTIKWQTMKQGRRERKFIHESHAEEMIYFNFHSIRERRIMKLKSSVFAKCFSMSKIFTERRNEVDFMKIVKM